MKQEQLQTIHDSFINGQSKQAVRQIDEYGLYDFWTDYDQYLMQICGGSWERAYADLKRSIVFYNRIKNR